MSTAEQNPARPVGAVGTRRSFQEALMNSRVSGSVAAASFSAGGPHAAAFLRMLEPGSVAVQLQNIDIVSEAIEQCAASPLPNIALPCRSLTDAPISTDAIPRAYPLPNEKP